MRIDLGRRRENPRANYQADDQRQTVQIGQGLVLFEVLQIAPSFQRKGCGGRVAQRSVSSSCSGRKWEQRRGEVEGRGDRVGSPVEPSPFGRRVRAVKGILGS